MGLRIGLGGVCWLALSLLISGVAVAEEHGGEGQAGTADTAGPLPNLDPAQINVIKVWEIDLSEEPNVQVPREVVEELLDRYRGHDSIPKGKRAQAMFRALPGYRKLETIFAVKAREFYDRIVVRGDPPALLEFRRNIHPRYVLNYCGTAGCHGGSAAGRFRLQRERASTTETIYTNFYILSTARAAGESVIDRHTPEQSLLLRYGLPARDTETPHPDVPGWRQAFNTPDDRRYRQIEQWILTLFPDPDYQIEYPPRPDGKPDGADPPATAAP